MDSKQELTPPHRSMGTVLLLALSVMLSTLWFFRAPAATTVSYDHRAITINGQRRILISGSIHYPRSTPEMWPDLIRKAKEGGLDVIETYVFWDRHEPSPGQYNFEGKYDLVRFIKLVKEAGMYLHLRLGPYVCAEWNFGGFPIWLKYVPGISFRTDNEPFKAEMERFIKKIVNMMKSERLYAWQGGPIILTQIENEYGPVQLWGGPGDKVYAAWTARLALGLDTGVPWVMCKQEDAPDPIIDTCNGFYCDGFTPNKPSKPKMWTETWTGWFTSFGAPIPHRPVEDLAYAVVSFIQNGGSFFSYYMYHGGTNFGRTAGNFIATSYDYDAPIDEYGLLRPQKWGHLRELHRAIKSCESALVNGDPTVTILGHNQQSFVFRSDSGACAAFLSNNNTESNVTVAFNGMHYELPPRSISILPDCKTAVYNTARIGVKTAEMEMARVRGFSWSSYSERIDSDDHHISFSKVGLLEQVNVTRDTTDYLWYTTSIDISQDENFLKNDRYPVLSVSSVGPSLHVYINGKLSGFGYGGLEGSKLTYRRQVKLSAGRNKISILSVAVGLYNAGTHFESWNYGILGPVTLSGLNEGFRDLSNEKWTYKIGLEGEAMNLHSPDGSSSVEWGEASQNQPLTWYKASFDAPDGNDPLALDMVSMGKGLAWINGQGIGRYWPAYRAHGTCPRCDYRHFHNEKNCTTGCGEPSQRWYHVPRSWLHPTDNLLVVLEEWGGDPTGITLVKRRVQGEGSKIAV